MQVSTDQKLNQSPIEASLSFRRGNEPASPSGRGEVCIIGGGLAGLSLSILLAKEGWKVLLFEKNKYPFHKVCGEYISMESKPFLERLGVDLPAAKFPVINTLQVTATSGVEVQRPLDMGGFGISRYQLDHQLALMAENSGVTIIHERVEEVQYDGNTYMITAGKNKYQARACAGSFGKRSNLDVKWKRPFVQSAATGLNNYIGIKYHIRYHHPKNLIALHNFKNGYCGVSAIEDERYCLCYLTSAGNLKASNNDIKTMESNILHQNKHLKKIFTEAEFLYKEPLVISQVSFANKEQAINQIPLCGDAAGLITPLCGNGMSMAMKASSMLAPLINDYLHGKLSQTELNIAYTSNWNAAFKTRLKIGRTVQNLFGNDLLTSAFLQTCRLFPALADILIKKTHGDPY